MKPDAAVGPVSQWKPGMRRRTGQLRTRWRGCRKVGFEEGGNKGIEEAYTRQEEMERSYKANCRTGIRSLSHISKIKKKTLENCSYRKAYHE